MELLLIQCRLWLDMYLFPHWMHNRTPDENHHYRRLFTPRYQLKKRLVKNIWIGACVLILLNPVVSMLLLIALPATFLSFALLDETP